MNRCTGAARDDDDSMYFDHSNAVVVGVGVVESTVSFDCVVVCCGGDGSGFGVVVAAAVAVVISGVVAVGAATVTVGAIMLFIVVLLG